MRSALLVLVGFTAFVLCPTTCPMKAEVASTAVPIHHEMHAHDAQHEHEEAQCEHCDTSINTELALMNGPASGIVAPVALPTFIAYYLEDSLEPLDTGVPRSHMEAIGLPIAPEIVSTVVLRT